MSLSYRNLLYVLVGLLLSSRLVAQSPHYFVYIQSEKNQPFYIKYKGNILSSSDKGYLILSELPAGTVPVTLGFPKNEAPEQLFYLKVAKNDEGYLLKKGADNAYTLYNLQTFAVLKSGEKKAPESEPAQTAASTLSSEDQADLARREMLTAMHKDLQDSLGDKAIITTDVTPPAAGKTNSFASALDKVVKNDRPKVEPVEEPASVTPAETPAAGTEEGEKVVKKADKKHKHKSPLTEEEQALLTEVLAEEHKVAAANEALPEQQQDAAPVTEEPVKKHVKKAKKAAEPDFIEFTDTGAPAATTVAGAATATVSAPVDFDEPGTKRKKKLRKITDRLDDTERPNNIITDTSGYGVAMHEEEPRSSKKKKKDDAADAAMGDESSSGKKAPVKMINSDCGNIMDDATFRKMLKKVVSAKDDDGMIDVFRKQTRNYCVETAQVRTIAQLLSAEEFRYKLLDFAYAKTYDSEKYGTLENLLNESYYKGRFKAMLKK
jgi:chemotaxis protein histidine kinase CheA